MRTYRIFLWLGLLGIFVPAFFLVQGLAEINWNMARAWDDLQQFIFHTTFGKVVLAWLLFSGAALTLFATHEAIVRHDYYLLWILPVILFFSIGAALPLYIYLRMPKRDQ